MKITKQKVEQMRDYSTRRFCFDGDKNALKRRPKDVENYNHGLIELPFGHGIKHVFPQRLWSSRFTQTHREAVWRSFQSDKERQEAEAWCDTCEQTVFLYDCLDVSIAISFNFVDKPGNYTVIGQLEHNAKHVQDAGAIQEIINHLTKRIQFFDILKHADFVCGVPKHQGKGFHLPEELARGVATSLQKTDITQHLEFDKSKQNLKGLPYHSKWDALENSSITFLPQKPDLTNSKIILIDDKYQSGVTIQFVASKLQEQGAKEVYGLCAVKTWSDDDNQI